MSSTLYKRRTILIPSGPSHDPERLHLCIICSDPCSKKMISVVPISTYTNDKCDQTCIINTNDHKFVRHKSYVLYRNARIIGCNEVLRGINEGKFTTHDNMNAQTFLRISNGMCRSEYTPRKVKIYLNCKTTSLAN